MWLKKSARAAEGRTMDDIQVHLGVKVHILQSIDKMRAKNSTNIRRVETIIPKLSAQLLPLKINCIALKLFLMNM